MNITAYSEYNHYLSRYWELINGLWYQRGMGNNKPTSPNDVILEYLKWILEESQGEIYG